MRDIEWNYTWYEPNDPANKGSNDSSYMNIIYLGQKDNGARCNPSAYRNADNTSGLCGLKNWLLSKKDELVSLVSCSQGRDDWRFHYSCLNYKKDQKSAENDNIYLLCNGLQNYSIFKFIFEVT